MHPFACQICNEVRRLFTSVLTTVQNTLYVSMGLWKEVCFYALKKVLVFKHVETVSLDDCKKKISQREKTPFAVPTKFLPRWIKPVSAKQSQNQFWLWLHPYAHKAWTYYHLKVGYVWDSITTQCKAQLRAQHYREWAQYLWGQKASKEHQCIQGGNVLHQGSPNISCKGPESRYSGLCRP